MDLQIKLNGNKYINLNLLYISCSIEVPNAETYISQNDYFKKS